MLCCTASGRRWENRSRYMDSVYSGQQDTMTDGAVTERAGATGPTTSHTRGSTSATPLTPHQRLNQPQQLGQRAPGAVHGRAPLSYGTGSKTSTAAF
jgi:hypothetical protein